MSEAPAGIADGAWRPPDRFEEYRIVRALGAGAMGQVYLAHDMLLDRPVAIKFVGARDVGTTARERFFIEARAVARLAHPNVVTIHRVGELAHRPYLVSEFVRGTSLAALPRPVPWERALRIGAGLARGLAAAHRRGVLHRDLKPANAMLDEDGEAKLLDFGLAVLGDDAPREVAPDAAPLPRTGDPSATTSIAGSASIAGRISRTTDAAAPSRASDAGDASQAFDAAARSQAGEASRAKELAPGTRPGAALAGARIVGTPLYLAPELWTGGAATRASDIYALGVVLYELLAGTPPHAGVGLEQLALRVTTSDAPSLAEQVPHAPAQFTALVDACVHRDATQRPESADALAATLEAILEGDDRPHIEGSPYRGLSTFEHEHRAVFFGRAEDTRAVVERLRTETFVVVAGDSGAGKSSLCRAAVLPAIAEKAIAGRRWRTATLVPGARPSGRLEELLATRGAGENLLLFVDQLEELLTVSDPEECEAVALRLAGLAVAGSGVRILASARSDFLGRLAALPALGELIGRALYLLGPLGERGLRDAIAGPARALGFELAPELVDELVASGRRNLPLLQFTLAELWDARDDKAHTIPAGALAQIGGVGGALARRADQVMAALGDDERELAWRVFVRLATAEGTRAVMSRRELGEVLGDAASAERIVERLVGARLLAVADGGDRVEVVHEALLANWPRLVAWRRTHEEGTRMRDLHTEAARAWDRQGRPRGLLWRGDALADYRAWRRRWPEPPTGLEAAFAAASEAEARRARRLRVGVFAAIVVVLAIGVVVLYRSDRRAESERDEAIAQRAEALRQRRALLVEHGAQELAAGHPARALVYLVEALREGEDTPALRVLIAAAARPIERQVLTIRDLPAGYTGAAWSPDGTHIAATAMDGTAVVYDRSGKRVHETKVPINATSLFGPSRVVFAPSGKHVAFATTLSMHLWNLETGAVSSLGEPLAEEHAFVGARLVTRAPGGLRAWRLDGTLDRELGPVACFTPAKDTLLIVGLDGTISSLDAAGVRTPRAKVLPLRRCSVQIGGVRVAVGAIREDRGTFDVTVFEDADFRRGGTQFPDNAGFLLSGDGTRLATSDPDGVRVWDLATGRSVYAVPLGGANDATFGVFDHASKRLVAFGRDRVHRVIDLVDLRLAWEYEATTTSPTAPHATARTIGVLFSPDDRLLLTATGNEISVQLSDRAPLVDEILTPNAFTARLSPGEREVAIGQHGRFELWDLERHVRTSHSDLEGPDTRIWVVTWSPDGERVALAGGDGRVEVRARTGELVRRLAGRAGAPSMNHVAWSFDGKRLVSATDDGAAIVWDPSTGARVTTLPHGKTRVLAAKFGDGARVATASWDGTLRVWNADTATVETEIRDEVLRFLDVAWSPDRTRLAASTHSGVVGVWDLATKRRVFTVTGHMGSVTAVVWSPDGNLLATSGIDGTTRVWDAATGRQLVSHSVRGEALDVSWSRDGERIVVAGGNVRVWSVRRDPRTITELDSFITARVPWRLVDGRLELVR